MLLVLYSIFLILQKISEETEKLSDQTRAYNILSFSDATLASLIKNFSELSIPKVAIGYIAVVSAAKFYSVVIDNNIDPAL